MIGSTTRGIRSFVAVLLPDVLRAEIHAQTAPLRRRAPRLAWVREENLHLTLRFLGEVDHTMIERVQEALMSTAEGIAPFEVTLGGLGGFPSRHAPRVVWVGVTLGGDRLVALAARLDADLGVRGIPPEGRAFHPHVTLGRARDPGRARGLEAALAEAPRFGACRVDRLSLMRSELARGGSRYGVLAQIELGGTEGSSGVDFSGSGR